MYNYSIYGKRTCARTHASKHKHKHTHGAETEDRHRVRAVRHAPGQFKNSFIRGRRLTQHKHTHTHTQAHTWYAQVQSLGGLKSLRTVRVTRETDLLKENVSLDVLSHFLTTIYMHKNMYVGSVDWANRKTE